MIKLGITEWYLPRQGPASLYYAKKCNLPCIQIDCKKQGSPYFLGGSHIINEYLNISKKTGVKIVAVAINSANQTGISVSNDSILSESQQLLLTALHAAKKLAVNLIFIPSFYKNKITTTKEFNNTASFFQWACDQAIQHEITLASENSLSLENNIKLVRLVNRVNFKILFDTYNSIPFKINTLTLIKNLWPLLANQIHIKDGINNAAGETPIGSGEAKLEEILTFLKEKNFSGHLVLENKYNTKSIDKIKKDIEFINDKLRCFS